MPGDAYPTTLGLTADLGQTIVSARSLEKLGDLAPDAVLLSGDLSYLRRADKSADAAAAAGATRIVRGDDDVAAAATTRIVRGDESRRRRGFDADVPRRRLAATQQLRRG